MLFYLYWLLDAYEYSLKIVQKTAYIFFNML